MNLCSMALDYKKKGGKRSARVFDFSDGRIIQALEHLGVPVNRIARKSLGKTVHDFVSEHCPDECLLLQ